MTAAHAGRVLEQLERLYVGARNNSPAHEPETQQLFALQRQTAYTQRAARDRVHTRVSVDARALHEAIENGTVQIQRRRHDGGYGLVVLESANVGGLEVGDELLSLHGKQAVWPTAAAVEAAVHGMVATFDGLVVIRLYRPPDGGATQRAFAAEGEVDPGAAPDGAPAAVDPAGDDEDNDVGAAEGGDGNRVGYSVSSKTVDAATLKRPLEQRAFDEGRVEWRNGLLQERLAVLQSLSEVEVKAVRTQERLLATLGLGDAFRAAVTAAAAADAQPAAQHVWRALAIAAEMMPDLGALYYHSGRVAADTESKRCRARLMDKTVHETAKFAGCAQPRNAAAGLPVVFLGAWAMGPRRRSGNFALKAFVKKLAAKVIVVVASEHRTTVSCGHCGGPVSHPSKGRTPAARAKKRNEFRGTVYCADKTCASHGRLFNRDVHAACNIVNRWVYEYLVGGELGL